MSRFTEALNAHLAEADVLATADDLVQRIEMLVTHLLCRSTATASAANEADARPGMDGQSIGRTGIPIVTAIVDSVGT